ncbi:MAG TPA: ABC transporter ATP-binding protein [Marinilabiliaceae bacterium]|nr:ABC transporter ATP-binding protein [Marinilabiliaceae bacterium]
MAFLEAQHIVKKYANHLALDDVNISIPENSIFGLLGPNGAGKTTFIRIINQITGPDEGTIFFNGQPLQSKHIAQIGYLPEERGLYKKMKVGEQALYLAQLKGMSRLDALKKLKYWFEKFEISAWWDKKVEELSKGMQQKIQFIVTILHQPSLLILDEPFSGFDPINTKQIKEEILHLKKEGATIIFSTHNMGSVEELCDHITLINKGKSILSGEVAEIRREYRDNPALLEYSNASTPIESLLPPQYIVHERSQTNGYSMLRIDMPKDASLNELIQLVSSHCQIHSCSEILPGMDEVFIRVVDQNR